MSEFEFDREWEEPAYGERPVDYAFSFVDTSGWTWHWPAGPVEHFRPDGLDPEAVSGDPNAALDHWSQQTYPDTCSIVAQQCVLEEMTGATFSEDALRDLALQEKVYVAGGGTPMALVGALLELHGVGVEQTFHASLNDLKTQLEAGNKVLVSVDAHELRTSGIDVMRDEWFGDQGGIPGRDANHTVQVIGVDETDPADPKVILNDPGGSDGRGMVLPAEKFLDCWADSEFFMVHTTGEPPDLRKDSVMAHYDPMLGAGEGAAAFDWRMQMQGEYINSTTYRDSSGYIHKYAGGSWENTWQG